ncbi:dihydroxyacetone kinase subunit DhaL [Pullulanibacillus sp. KACC 23026]|uniref:dihydroxyacetone kinase subunit DhaL n=1 Tax=Pullulanibacillus sp. KACC 23026 TaxID=3028315 RepID=UPI0031B5E070
MNVEVFRSWLRRANEKIQENKDYLSELDRAIGDGDHGINLSRGFEEVIKKLEAVDTTDIGALLQQTAMTLISKVGGASGPLYGTAFLKAATVLKGKEAVTHQECAEAFNASLEGLKQRGKAAIGDKTMIDVWEPVVSKWLTEQGVYDALIELTEQSMEATKDLEAKKGRAAYLGKRSVGTLDPGAVSSALILTALFYEIKGAES